MTNRETIQLFVAADADAASIEICVDDLLRARSDIQQWHLGRNLEGSWGAGTYTLDLLWRAGAPSDQSIIEFTRVPGFVSADRVTYQSIGSGMRDTTLRNGIWRTLLLRARPGIDAQQVRGLEQDLLRMPNYMQGIRNWNLSRVTSPSSWTHVWQQEYHRIDDLMGEYLLHPFHWGWVDRWFDPEFPEWTVDHLSHAFCALKSSVLNNGQ
jgi:stress responsive alpha/beta barrel protein